MGKLLAIDLGTTYFKLSLFDREGHLRDTCQIAPPLVATRPGWMELSAEAFEKTIARGIADLRSRIRGDLTDLAAVTFATQTNSFVLLDSEHRPLTPLVLWPDRRAAQLDAEVRSRCNVPQFAATTGLPQIDFQCMAAKLLWLQNESPEIWKRTNKLCLISDYLTLLMTGKHVTEAGAAGLTGLVDIHRCRWYPEMLANFNVDLLQMPDIVRAGTDLGPIDPRAAERFGLPASCRFVVGCLDQYAGAIGVGNVEPGLISETTGTVLATVRCADRFAAQPDDAVRQGPAFREGLYWQMAVGLISANYLHWYRDRLPDRPDFDRLTALAEQVELGSDGLRLRADVVLTDPEEVFQGLTVRHGHGHKVRCILESVACALDDQVAALANGSRPGHIRCAGGAARSKVWLQIKADVLGMPTAATGCPEPTSLGAAVLARASLDGTEVRTVARQWAHLQPPHHPDPNRHQRYRVLRSGLGKSNENV
jgi:xylulokinase